MFQFLLTLPFFHSLNRFPCDGSQCPPYRIYVFGHANGLDENLYLGFQKVVFAGEPVPIFNRSIYISHRLKLQSGLPNPQPREISRGVQRESVRRRNAGIRDSLPQFRGLWLSICLGSFQVCLAQFLPSDIDLGRRSGLSQGITVACRFPSLPKIRSCP